MARSRALLVKAGIATGLVIVAAGVGLVLDLTGVTAGVSGFAGGFAVVLGLGALLVLRAAWARVDAHAKRPPE